MENYLLINLRSWDLRAFCLSYNDCSWLILLYFLLIANMNEMMKSVILNIFLNPTAKLIYHLVIVWCIYLIHLILLICFILLRLFIHILWLVIFCVFFFIQLSILVLCSKSVIWFFTLTIPSKCILKYYIRTFSNSYSSVSVISILII